MTDDQAILTLAAQIGNLADAINRPCCCLSGSPYATRSG